MLLRASALTLNHSGISNSLRLKGTWIDFAQDDMRTNGLAAKDAQDLRMFSRKKDPGFTQTEMVACL